MGVGGTSQTALSTEDESLSSSCRSRCHQSTEMGKHQLSVSRDLSFDKKLDLEAAAIRITVEVSNSSLTTWGVLHLGYRPSWAFTYRVSWWERSHMDILPEYSLGDLAF